MAAAANNPQLLPVSKLTCGFCGFVSPHFNADPNNVWAPYYRAVYAVGPLDSHESPRLSGVGFHRHHQIDKYLPARTEGRWDDAAVSDGAGQGMGLTNFVPSAGPTQLVRIRDIKPPGPEVPAHEQYDYAWGFLFHEACWSVLEQALKPSEVDIAALWRILCSVPCGSELPNWGHNYGGLYMGTMRDQARGEHFVLLGRNSNLVIPSTFSNPFRVPELERLVLQNRIVTSPAVQTRDGGNAFEPDQQVSAEGRPGVRDPFAALPPELKEMLLCYMRSPDAAALRLASRALASTPLTQHFFQSRFWPGREMAVFFDAFLLPAAEVRGTDWRRLYWQLKIRLKYNRVGLGERNRLRLWTSTIRPLADAIDHIRLGMSELKGGPDWRWVGATSGEDTDAALAADWKICRTAKLQAPVVFGEIRRVVYRAEVELPAGAPLSGVYISFIEFFGTRYITGLRFRFNGLDDVELGYIMRNSEEYLPILSGCLAGFHCATDECGFRALALTEGRNVVSEYLDWAGQPEALIVVALKTAAKDGLRRIRASFDGFRLQALLIPEK